MIGPVGIIVKVGALFFDAFPTGGHGAEPLSAVMTFLGSRLSREVDAGVFPTVWALSSNAHILDREGSVIQSDVKLGK
jgi:hypothetical protein